MLFSQTPSHLVILRRVRIRRYHIKAVLAYGGAFLLAVDATVSVGVGLFPHAAAALIAWEGSASLCGKCGGAASGLAAFCDRIISAGIAEETGAALAA